MAYISKETVAQIRAALKAELPDYKFSARKDTGSHSIHVSFLRGPLPLQDDVKVDVNGYQFSDINHYHMQNYKHADLYEKVLQIIKREGEWFDKSDSMTDYFHTAFYINLHIGNGKGYEQVQAK